MTSKGPVLSLEPLVPQSSLLGHLYISASGLRVWKGLRQRQDEHSVPPPWWGLGRGPLIEPSNVADLGSPLELPKAQRWPQALSGRLAVCSQSWSWALICPEAHRIPGAPARCPPPFIPSPCIPGCLRSICSLSPFCVPVPASTSHTSHLILTMPDATGARRVKQLV